MARLLKTPVKKKGIKKGLRRGRPLFYSELPTPTPKVRIRMSLNQHRSTR